MSSRCSTGRSCWPWTIGACCSRAWRCIRREAPRGAGRCSANLVVRASGRRCPHGDLSGRGAGARAAATCGGHWRRAQSVVPTAGLGESHVASGAAEPAPTERRKSAPKAVESRRSPTPSDDVKKPRQRLLRAFLTPSTNERHLARRRGGVSSARRGDRSERARLSSQLGVSPIRKPSGTNHSPAHALSPRCCAFMPCDQRSTALDSASSRGAKTWRLRKIINFQEMCGPTHRARHVRFDCVPALRRKAENCAEFFRSTEEAPRASTHLAF